MKKILRLILGDQLNSNHSWFSEIDKNATYLIMEMMQEAEYTNHHIQKVVGFFLAMRNFAESIERQGHKVIYFSLDDQDNSQKLEENILKLIDRHGFDRFEYQLPDEYRLDQLLLELTKKLESKKSFSVRVVDTEHFLTERGFLKDFFKGKKTYLMETFYRSMRSKHDVLMDGKEPLTGKWNYDHENRNKLKDPLLLVKPKTFSKDVNTVVNMIRSKGVKTIGEIDEKNFDWPISREESMEALKYFCEKLLFRFGEYQDAMYDGDSFLFHSRLSFAMNVKMISPLEVVEYVEKYWLRHQDAIDVAQVEGFIRQIIGWREYMRGVYWAEMPGFAKLNFFDHKRKLPQFFWTGKTKMNCLKHAIEGSLKSAYAHHIQRLMVTGNFMLLAGIDPDEVDQWYLGIYIDAIEWVEITNTRGMSQFADGGIVGTKPYVSSANYIDKMSNYCESCFYKKNQKIGDRACPFNSLYWHFYARNEEKLSKNPRIGMAYRTLAKMKDAEAILKQAEDYLNQIEKL
ncbi:cryptochrome/photolyase family protein [Belliella kenyensis]|uniref:Cryptochrome/photolyase family protein n=1 Tax=Belliella kenyensis TaxID=1472724 RepID=A0ABV8EPK1_9BACT|nr:cryptochrome/photolyase family protein [Belliella kenyensis]MCH7402590.1 cryptochrome/photolyase family protein [Belliella kenyensis]MDN3603388.1 cryptochrome/photolyase family protein [Belliella kenyensis]